MTVIHFVIPFTDVGRCRDESGTPPMTQNMVLDDERYVGEQDCMEDYACTILKLQVHCKSFVYMIVCFLLQIWGV